MASDPTPDDPTPDDPTPRAGDPADAPRVARERYVRSWWGVLFAVGVVAGVVVLVTDFAAYDSAPLCDAVEGLDPEAALDGPAATATRDQAVAAAEERRSRLETFRDLLPDDLVDDADLALEREEVVLAALRDAPADAPPEEVARLIAVAEEDIVTAATDAAVAIDLYAATECGLVTTT